MSERVRERLSRDVENFGCYILLQGVSITASRHLKMDTAAMAQVFRDTL